MRRDRFRPAAQLVACVACVLFQPVSLGADDLGPEVDANAANARSTENSGVLSELQRTLNPEDVILEQIYVEKLLADETFLRGGTGSGTGVELACSCEEVVVSQCRNEADDFKKCFAHQVRDNECSQNPWTAFSPGDDIGRPSEGCAAWEHYQDVIGKVRLLRDSDYPLLTRRDRRAALDLIETDAKYRQVLLKRELPFWGAQFALSAEVPIRLLDRMQRYVSDMRSISGEITQYVTSATSADESALQSLAAMESALGSVRQSELNAARSRSDVAESSRAVQRASEQVGRLKELYDQLQAERARVVEEEKAIASSMNAAIMNAAAAAAGVPPGAVDAIKSGDGKAILSAAISTAISTDTDLGRSVRESLESTNTTSQVLALYDQGKSAVDQLTEIRNTARSLKSFVEEPSLEAVVAIGQKLHSQICTSPSDANRQVCDTARKTIERAPPALALINRVEALKTTLQAGSPTSVCQGVMEAWRGISDLSDASSSLSVKPEACGYLDLSRLPELCNSSSSGSTVNYLVNAGITVPTNAREGDGLQKLDGMISQACKARDAVVDVLDSTASKRALLTDWMQEMETTILSTEDRVYEALSSVVDQASEEVLRKIPTASLCDLVCTAFEVAAHKLLADPQYEQVMGAACSALGVPLRAASINADRDACEMQIKRRGLAQVPDVRVSREGMFFRTSSGDEVKVDLNDVMANAREVLRQQVAAARTGHVTTRTAEELRRARSAIGGLAKHEGNLRRALMGQLPTESQRALLGKTLDAAGWRASSLARRVWQAADGTSAELLDAQYAALGAAALTVPTAPMPSMPSNTDLQSGSIALSERDSSGDAAAARDQAMMAAALNYALPGAGVLISVVDGMFALKDAEARRRRLEDAIFGITLMTIHNLEAVYARGRDAALAELEIQGALAAQNAAAESSRIYRALALSQEQRGGASRERALSRRALAFYYSERLRETFARLDRSIGLWHGEARTPGREIERLIRSDPQNVRLAVDAEIGLFNWFTTDSESQRTNVDLMSIHWQEKLQLVQRICEQTGCQPGTGTLGEIQQTSQLSVQDLVDPVQWREFRHWQRDRSGGDEFTFYVLIHPGLAGFNPVGVNQRVIALATGFSRGGTIVEPTGSELQVRHPGFSVVPTLDPEASSRVRLEREFLLPRATASVDSIVRSEDLRAGFDLAALAERWGRQGRYEPKAFEGYGLFTTWELRLMRTQNTAKADDVVLRFAYVVSDPSAIRTEGDLVRALREGDGLFGIPTRTWRVYVGRDAGSEATSIASWDESDAVRQAYVGGLLRDMTCLKRQGPTKVDLRPADGGEAIASMTIHSDRIGSEQLQAEVQKSLIGVMLTARVATPAGDGSAVDAVLASCVGLADRSPDIDGSRASQLAACDTMVNKIAKETVDHSSDNEAQRCVR